MVEIINFPRIEQGATVNIEAEQALLGILLLNNENIEMASENLKPIHFADRTHARIFEAILHLTEKGQKVDAISLKTYFSSGNILDPVGGPKYLMELANFVIYPGGVKDYSMLLNDLFIRRELICIGEETIKEAQQHEMNLNGTQQIELAEKKLYGLAENGVKIGGFKSFTEALVESIESAEKSFKNVGKIVGVTTGLKDLDIKLGGLNNSDLLILAGRPGMGKTSLATNIAFNAAKSFLENDSNESVAFFSLEMSAEQLATRILSMETGISSEKIRNGNLTPNDFVKFIEINRLLSRLPLLIDEQESLSVSTIRNRARKLKRKEGLGLIVIDYLQLLESSDGYGRRENRVQEISDISRALKGLARELKVPVLALSQLSRAVENREDKRPHLSDLRDSGSIEQDADVVMFVYREEYYIQNSAPPEGTSLHTEWVTKMESIHNQAEVIISKQRNGPTGAIQLYFDPTLTKFENLDKLHELNSQRGLQSRLNSF